MKLSVVIPTMGRETVLRTVASLEACDGAEVLEICVVGKVPDGPVAEGLRDACRRWNNLRWEKVSFPVGDSSEKKNHGVRCTHGELVAFLDDDVVVDRGWAKAMKEVFVDPAVGLASGPSLVPEDVGRSARLAGLALTSAAAGFVAERYRRNADSPYDVDFDRIIGCNAAYRRKAFDEMGGFPADFYPGEEMIAAWRTARAGWTLRFVPGAKAWHYPRASAKRFWRQIWTYGATRVRLFRGGVRTHLAPLVPAAWVGSTLFLALAALAGWMLPTPPLLWKAALSALAAETLGYAAVVAWAAAGVARETGKRRDGWVWAWIVEMHAAHGLGAWAEFFRPGKDFSERPSARR
jgi:cellulose synthase/poly-beta-1,6-N-acetylglucosamine synthase-like glycosyltransferase